ncbi:MAG TPA: multiheme c-type cytochrome [Gemmatimonadales bacterium]|nr:multiheme c-type cytochrome [Gemmatimonadales bacterium]
MPTASWKARLGFAAVVALTVLAACTDTVYRDRPPFNPPPDGSSSGFLGYYDASVKQTTCGNCHVGQQADWIQTAHSDAWGDLQASGQQQAFCEKCHSVNSRGNQPLANVGYDSVKTPVYHDVQCESCHGPGFTHVQNPTIVANRPYPSILVYPTSDVLDTAAVVNSSCGACHQGAGPSQNHNYLKEWLSSRHGQLNTHAAPNANCQPCHEGKGALAAWGVNTVYKELGTTTLITQACPVCHDPHGTAKDANGQPFEGQTRFSINTPVIEQNLCTKCHNRIAQPDPASSRGPHGTQGPVLFGTAGYFPPGSSYDTTAILTTHGSTANPRLCAGCHVNTLTGVDAAGNEFAFSGHTFHPLPCLMQKTPTPIVDTTYANNCAYDEQSRSWAACTASGCHATEAIAVQRLQQIETERDGYIHTLWVDVNGNQKVDPFPTDSGYLAKIALNAPNDLDFTNAPYNTMLTPAKGALFNAQMLGENLASHPDGSHGVHNPFLYRALLQAAIVDLEANYGGFLPAPPAPIRAAITASFQSGFLRMPVATVRAYERATTGVTQQASAY